ncbi:hypothetical protein GCM10007874_17820 [Labrys miyagiensis]|uniref:Insertion element IS402-like domain-containing protein n=1 Tax=Labrys miyagiensis TaxID=346912 RepID=A0ABQ6CFR2_9HYPH|nr:hypothetical protein GCM10007874_17820 [Labrys miyagiensis]
MLGMLTPASAGKGVRKQWHGTNLKTLKKARGVAHVDDRRALNGIFRILRLGAHLSDLPECYVPVTTIYNRFQRWRKAAYNHDADWPLLSNELKAFGARF